MLPTDLQILFEDKYLLAVNKPNGIVTEHDERLSETLESLVLKYLQSKEKYPQKCFVGLPHRLDRPVSGVVLFAKKRSTLKKLGELFANRNVQKSYLAVVEKRPSKNEDELTNWIEKDQKNRKAIVHDKQTADSVQAILNYQILSEHESMFLLSIRLITGKFHQIRAQLSFIGCPVVGDTLYGATTSYPAPNGIGLHAAKLELAHPVTGEILQLNAPVPVNNVWSPFRGYEKLTLS